MKEFSLALKVFYTAAKTVPAYQRLLKHFDINPEKIKSVEDFRTLPVTDKKNYIYRNSLEDLFPKKTIAPMAYASSGSSGVPTFWFRNDEQEEVGSYIHERIFREIFHIKKSERTLVVICFAMGIWIAGNFTLASCRSISRKGYNLTTITPGIEQEDILEVLKRLAPNFQNLILAGYPPFIMNIADQAEKRGIRLKNKVHILTAGDKFSEKWRSDLLELLHIKDLQHSLISIYGSADAGILGYETPLTIFLRRKISESKNLSREFFGNYVDLPGLVQYDPKYIFFEEAENELVLTVNTALPLIRYNIHDVGHVLPYVEVRRFLKSYGLAKEAFTHDLARWKLPFLILKGRTDVATTFYALNILPEHIRAGIEKREVTKFLSGSFFAYNKTMNRSRDQKLYINLELNPGIKVSKGIVELIKKNILEGLLKWNIEFRKLYSTIGEKALPIITLYQQGEPSLQPEIRRSGLMYVKGKKPRRVAG